MAIGEEDINVNHRQIHLVSYACLSPHCPLRRPHTQQAEPKLSLPFNFKTPYFKKRKSEKKKNGISVYFCKDADTHLFSESQWVCHVKNREKQNKFCFDICNIERINEWTNKWISEEFICKNR